MRTSTSRVAVALTVVAAFAVAGVDGANNTAIIDHAPSSMRYSTTLSSNLDASYGVDSNSILTALSTATRSVVTVLQAISVCDFTSDKSGDSSSTFSSRPLIGTNYETSLVVNSTTRYSTALARSVRINASSSSTPKTSLIARANAPSDIDDRGTPVTHTVIYTGNRTSTVINVGTGSSTPVIKTPKHTVPRSSSLIGSQSGVVASTGNSPSSPATRSTPVHTSTRSSLTEKSTGSTGSIGSTNGPTSTRSSSTKESSGYSTPGHPTSPGQSSSPATTKQSTARGQESSGGSRHSHASSTTEKEPGSLYPGVTGLPLVPTITPGPISTSFTGPATANHTMFNAATTTTAHNVTAPVWIGSIRKHEAESEVSFVSTYLLKILPTLSDWELKPDPPLQTDIIKKIKGFEDYIKDLGIKIDPKWKPKCPHIVKRGLVDGLINSVTNVVKTGVGATTSVLSALGCIDDNTKRLIKGIENRNTEAVKGIVDTLTKSNPPKDDKPKDDDNPSTSKTKTSTKPKDEDDHSTTTKKSKDDSPPATDTTTTCTKHTAHHVTVLCTPTFSTMGTVSQMSTTCSPTTTLTTTGCSATDTTTTVTATPTEPGVCSPESCGKACSNGKGGWVTVGPVDCDAIPTKSWTLPVKSQATAKVINASPKLVRTRDTTLVQRQFSSDPLSGFTNFDMSVGYVTGLAKKITKENRWISQLDYTTGKWYELGDERLAAGVKPLHGCTAVFIVSREGVYVSHIYESPVFVNRNEQGIQETTDHEFRFNTIQALTEAVEWDYIDPLSKLVGTDRQPGPLHRSLSPHLIIITRNGDNGGLEYSRQVKILSDGLCAYLYSGYPCPANTHYDIGYDPVEEYTQGDFTLTPGQQANNDDMLVGKAIFEMTPLSEWVPADDWNSFIPIGSWRLWIQGQATSSVLFWNPKNRAFLNGRMRRRENDGDGEYKGVCAPESNNNTCSRNSCGDSCKGGSGGWLDLGKIDCAKIPISTVASLPAPTKGVNVRDYNLVDRVNTNPPPPLDPLVPLPPPPTDLNPGGGPDKFVVDVAELFTASNLWLDIYDSIPTTFRWRIFADRRGALGMKGLFGCTGLFIVSPKGIFVAHFRENPTFMQRFDEYPGMRFPRAPKDIIRDTVEVIAPEIRRLVASGDLHHSLGPKIYLVSPFVGWETEGPFLYDAALKLMSPLIARLIYPEHVGPDHVQWLGYQRPLREAAWSSRTPCGKAMMEATPLSKYYQGSKGLLPVGHIRFWVGGKLVVDEDFWSPQDAIDAGYGQRADSSDSDSSGSDLMVDMEDWALKGEFKRAVKKRAGVCPMPTRTKTKTSAINTSTKSTSKSSSKTTTASMKSTTKLPLTKTTKISTTTTSTTKSSPKPTSTNTSTINSTTKSITKTSSTKSTIKKPSTLAATIKSEPDTNTERPGGQPPGFDLPTYDPTKTAKTTKSTSSDDPRPTYPLGEPPDDLDIETACEIRQHGSGHMPDYNRELYQKITNMCTDKISNKEKNFDKDSRAISWTTSTDDKKTYYYAEVSWSMACEGEKKTVNVLKPKDGLDCKTLLRANFQGCRTPSFGGGTTTIGCISYLLRQGKDAN